MTTPLDRETDARFWAETRYKPGQKLDPRDPADARMIPAWIAIQNAIIRERATGKPATPSSFAEAHAQRSLVDTRGSFPWGTLLAAAAVTVAAGLTFIRRITAAPPRLQPTPEEIAQWKRVRASLRR